MSPRQLKVYGLHIHTLRGVKAIDVPGRRRLGCDVVGAFTSWQAFADALGEPISWVREYGSETGNPAQVAAAMSKPGRIFWQFEDGYQADGSRDRDAWIEWGPSQDEAAAARQAHLQRIRDDRVRAFERDQERERLRARKNENDRSAAEWAQRLRDEFAIDCEAANNGHVAVTAPAEELYRRLVDIQGALRDLGLEELLTEGARP